MTITVFRTPLIRPLLAFLSRLGLRLFGWRVLGAIPDTRRFVLIGVPHTSNWDFLLMLMAVLDRGLELHWMGKHTLFRWPFGALMRWLGGLAIDRNRANNTVAQMLELFENNTDLVVLTTPEGTRSKVQRWKTGFYHIAHGAGVPILLGYVDASKKELGFGPLFFTTGDLDQDLLEIQRFYADKVGIRRR